jgi:hypothetical protein
VKNEEEKNGEKLRRRENELKRRLGEDKYQFYRENELKRRLGEDKYQFYRRIHRRLYN